MSWSIGVYIFQAWVFQAFGFVIYNGNIAHKHHNNYNVINGLDTHYPDDMGWDGLRVTFSPDISNPNAFSGLPRTVSQAKADGWKQTEQDATCDDGFYYGYRYIMHDDPSVMLLYDDNGYIAGIQTGISDSIKLPHAAAKYMDQEKDKGIQTATAYFVDPGIICNGGRTEDQFKAEGTGDRLLFRYASQLEYIPAHEEDMKDRNEWAAGKCVTHMGQHYYYNIGADATCEEFEPFFVLYDKGMLKAFGWGFLDFKLPSSRWEYTNGTFGMQYFLPDSYPACMHDVPILSAIHVYLTDQPENIECSKIP